MPAGGATPAADAMKLAYVLPVYWPAIGGCEVHTRELARRVACHHDVRVITLIDSQEEKLVDHRLWRAVTIHSRSQQRTYRSESLSVHKPGISRTEKALLYPFLRSVQLYTLLEPVALALLTRIFMRKLAPALSGCTVIHSIFGGLSFLSYAALLAARKTGIPFVFTPLLHLYDDEWQEKLERHRQGIGGFVYSPKLRLEPMSYHDRLWARLCRQADGLIAMTEYEKDFLCRTFAIPDTRVHAIGVGPVVTVEANGPRIRKRHNITDRQKIILFLGRNHEFKGIRELCQAARLVWKTHPDAVFLFVGPKEGRSAEIFAAHADHRLITVDRVEGQEKTDYLAACDIFCLPSLHESFGGVFLEAWVLGKPVIGCKIPPVMELNESEQGGPLVDLTPEALAAAIDSLITNPELATRMGAWGREKAMRQFGWERIAERMENIYEELC